MRVNSVSNNSVRSYAQPSFKAQMSKEDIQYALNKMKTIELYNPYEKIPQLYTVLEYAKTCPGDKLSFYFHNESNNNGVSLDLDNKRIGRASYRDDAWALIIKSYVGNRNPNITTHARMPEDIFAQKWFENRNVTEQDVLNLAYDA